MKSMRRPPLHFRSRIHTQEKMDSLSNSSLRTTMPPAAPETWASMPSEEKIDSLLDALAIWHCEKPTVLKALQHTCLASKEEEVDHALSGFANSLERANLTTAEMQLLQKGLIAHLPEHMKQEASAFFPIPGQHGQQSGTQDGLRNWAAAHISAAKVLENFPSAPEAPLLVLQALSYAWGFRASQALAATTLIDQLENAKTGHLQNLADGSPQFMHARNAFNDAVRSQLVNLDPAIKAQYQQLDASGIGYEDKKKKMGALIQLHLGIGATIAGLAPGKSESWEIARFAVKLACKGFSSPASSSSMPLVAAAFITTRNQYLALFPEGQERNAAASGFDEGLLRRLADLIHDLAREKYQAIMNGPGTLEQKQNTLLDVMSAANAWIIRNTDPLG